VNEREHLNINQKTKHEANYGLNLRVYVLLLSCIREKSVVLPLYLRPDKTCVFHLVGLEKLLGWNITHGSVFWKLIPVKVNDFLQFISKLRLQAQANTNDI